MEVSRGEKIVLSVLRNSRRPVKVPEIAERSGLKLRTVYYILEQLKGKDLVEKTWEGYRLKRKRGSAFEMVYVSYGVFSVLASVPLGNPALTVFGSICIILGKLAGTLEKHL